MGREPVNENIAILIGERNVDVAWNLNTVVDLDFVVGKPAEAVTSRIFHHLLVNFCEGSYIVAFDTKIYCDGRQYVFSLFFVHMLHHNIYLNGYHILIPILYVQLPIPVLYGNPSFRVDLVLGLKMLVTIMLDFPMLDNGNQANSAKNLKKIVW